MKWGTLDWRGRLMRDYRCIGLFCALPVVLFGVLICTVRSSAKVPATNATFLISEGLQSLLIRMSAAQVAVTKGLLHGPGQASGTAAENVLTDFEKLNSAVVDAEQRRSLQQMRPVVEQHQLIVSRLRRLADSPEIPPAEIWRSSLDESEALLTKMHAMVRDVQRAERSRYANAVVAAREDEQRDARTFLAAVVGGTIVCFGVFWFALRWAVQEERRRMEQLASSDGRKVQEAMDRMQAQARELAASEEELRRHKQMLESVMDSLQDGVAVVAPGGELLLFNPAAARIFESLPTISVDQWAAYYGLRPPEGTPCAPDCFTIARALQGEQIPEQTVFVAQGEQGLWLRLSGRPLLTAAGEVRAALVVFTDISAHHRNQEVLRRAKEEAEQANLAKSEFLSRMSHELRTPLNAILGFGQLLELAQLKSPHRDGVAQILRAGKHLLNLINEVLEISRIESGRLSLSLEPVEVAEVVSEALAMLKPQAHERGVVLDVSVIDANLHVIADRQRLRQVILNLLSNAIKYNRPQGRVTVSCDSAADRARLMVTDTGPGISAEQQARLFTPFERLGAEKSGVEGAGIGLALSKRLMEAMAGQIGVESAENEGSTFWISLPVTHPVFPAPHATSDRKERGEERPTVLCIEDNPSNLELIEHIFQSRPELQLVSAVTGGEGLEKAHACGPSLILLDIHLPDIDGENVLRQLKADESTSAIPVLVVTADATARQETRMREAGATGYLTKPLDVPHFLARIDEVLHDASVR